MKKYIITLSILFVCFGLFAQGEMDAIRLSSSDLRGTARGQAMGGAFGALGGDATGIMINPAGLGLYHSSELNLSLPLNSNDIHTVWPTMLQEESESSRFLIDNISFVGSFPTNNGNLQGLNFAFSYNRLKNFNRSYSVARQAMNTSMTDYIAAITNGIYYEDMNFGSKYAGYDPYGNNKIPWLSTLGWLGYLIDDHPENSYSGLFPNERPVAGLKVNERGYIESGDFSFGGNWWNKLYLGLTVSVTDMFYHWDSSYEEKFAHGKIGLENYLETEGNGFQVKLGAIGRPFDFLRLGVAYHSPVWYYLTDYYQGSTTAVYPDVDEWAITPDDALTHYRFHTPQTWVFSIAGILGTKAIVSFDYELKDYKGMTVKDDRGLPKKDTNGFIEEDFKVASTLRAGLEYRFTPQFSGRLGYSYMQNPYEKTFKNGEKEVVIIGTIPHYTIAGDVNYFTAGMGYRFASNFYVDMAFIYRTQKDDLYYFPSIFGADGDVRIKSTPASLTNRAYKGLVTVGYKFKN